LAAFGRWPNTPRCPSSGRHPKPFAEATFHFGFLATEGAMLEVVDHLEFLVRVKAAARRVGALVPTYLRQ
jgi:hypothetical protein